MMAVIALAGGGSDSGTEPTAAGVTGGPLYAVQYSVPNVSDGYDAYVGFVSSLEPQQVDPSRSLEVTGERRWLARPRADRQLPAQGLAWAPRFQANMI